MTNQMQLHPFASLTSRSLLIVHYGEMPTGLRRLGFTGRTSRTVLSMRTSENHCHIYGPLSFFSNTASPANTSHARSGWRKPVPVSPELEQGGAPAGMVPLRPEHTVSDPLLSLNITFEAIVSGCCILSLCFAAFLLLSLLLFLHDAQ